MTEIEAYNNINKARVQGLLAQRSTPNPRRTLTNLLSPLAMSNAANAHVVVIVNEFRIEPGCNINIHQHNSTAMGSDRHSSPTQSGGKSGVRHDALYGESQ